MLSITLAMVIILSWRKYTLQGFLLRQANLAIAKDSFRLDVAQINFTILMLQLLPYLKLLRWPVVILIRVIDWRVFTCFLEEIPCLILVSRVLSYLKFLLLVNVLFTSSDSIVLLQW